jgi:phage repressor protein C with HTH and peptisase S24 domain
MSIGERLKMVRGKRKQETFAAQLRVTKNTYGRYEREINPIPSDILKEVCDQNGISPLWLLTGEGPMKRKDIPIHSISQEFGEHAAMGDDYVISDPEAEHLGNGYLNGESRFVFIPAYNVEASAGDGAFVIREQVIDSLAFKRDWIRHELGAQPSDLALIYVEGDSMWPTLAPGDIILIDRRDTRVSRDGIYVLRIDEAVLVKRLHRLPGGIIEATGDNPAGRAFEIRLDTQDQDLAVIGRVVWAGKRL